MSSKLIVTFKRIMSAVVALPIYLYLVFTDVSTYPVLIVTAIVSSMCLYEFYQIVKDEEKGEPFKTTGLIFGFLLNILVYFYAFGKISGYNKYIGEYDVRPAFALLGFFLVIVMIIQIFKAPLKGAIYSVSTTIFGVVFISFSFSHLILLKVLTNGIWYILLLHIVVMINDSFAYFGGLFFGKHKTGMQISPNKTWEGYFSGMLFSIIAVVVYNDAMFTFFSIELFTTFEAACAGIILSFLGNMGDLIESAIKRDANIKDSGSIVPGHGGMWDVFDAIIFTLPIFYYFLKFKSVMF
jgi:phosphatidate cytidylyltransferase